MYNTHDVHPLCASPSCPAVPGTQQGADKQPTTHPPCAPRQQQTGHSLAGMPLDAVGEGHLKGRGHTVQADWHLLLCRHVGIDYLKPRQHWSSSKCRSHISAYHQLLVLSPSLSCRFLCGSFHVPFTNFHSFIQKCTLHGSMKLWKQTLCSFHVPFLLIHSCFTILC